MEEELVKWNCRCGYTAYSHPGGKMACMRCTIEMVKASDTEEILNAMKARRASPPSGSPL